MRWLRGVLICLAYAGITVLALVQLVLTLVVFLPGFGLGMVFLLTRPIEWGRRVTNLWRRVVRRLSGVDIPVPYKPAPPPPVPEADGLYRHDNGLHKSPRLPAFFDRLDWVLKDPGTGYDLLWHLLMPTVGVFLSWTPLLLMAYGVSAPFVSGRPLWTVLAAPAGLAVAPGFAYLYARFTKGLLFSAPHRAATRTGCKANWLQTRFLYALESVVIIALAALDAVALAVVVLGVTLAFGIGFIFAFAPSLQAIRLLLNVRRRIAGDWCKVPIEEPYQPLEPVEHRPDGMYRVHRRLFKTERWAKAHQRWHWVARDVATWRDVLFLAVDPLATVAIIGVPLAMFGYGVWGLFLPSITGPLFGGPQHPWYGMVGDGAAAGTIATPVGGALAIAGILLVKYPLKWHGTWTRVLLAPTERAKLRSRVARLTQTRTDAIDAQAAEVRRIERDLHDGAQARLIAVGMTLGTIERLMDTDPDAARNLLSQARETSQTALTDLRNLVRGILPPVLSERGLGDAVRALALDASVPVSVEIDLAGRLAAPVESAAYFAVSEILANAVKHGHPRKVSIDLRHREGRLRMTVTDDGDGGADPSRGTGLRGVERRLGTFDGTITLHSPAGGPTVVTMEVPCESFSPKTSSSSGTA